MKFVNRRENDQRSSGNRQEERRGKDRRINLPGDWSGVEKRSNDRRAMLERRLIERREAERRRDQEIIESGWPLIVDD